MAALENNQYYKLRLKDGRNPIFNNQDEVIAVFNDYSEWVENNPIISSEAFAYQGLVNLEAVPKLRAMSIEGFCVYAGMGRSTFQDYEKKQDFSVVFEQIKTIIETQQFEGATSGLLNGNIIARKLGLTERTDLTTLGDKITQEQPITADQAKAILDNLSKL